MADLQAKLAAVTAVNPNSPLASRLHLIAAVFSAQESSATLSDLFDLLCQGHHSSTNSSSNDSCRLDETITTAAAALFCLSTTKASSLVLRQFVQQAFLPLAAATVGTPVSIQLLQQLGQLLAENQAWDIAYEIIQCVSTTLATALEQISSGTTRAEPQATQIKQEEAGRPGPLHWQITYQLPPLVACVAADVINATAVAQQGQGESSNKFLQCILQQCSGPLFSTACGLLACNNAVLRKAAFQQLLPTLLSAAALVNPTVHEQCVQQLWKQCLDMIRAPALPRRMGLTVLLQYHSTWNVQPPSATDAADNSADKTDASSSEQFWLIVRDCLVDPEALNRKRAFRLLQLLLPETQLAAEPVWNVWLALYELLDEFSPHLVKAAWPQISQLHPAGLQFAQEDAAADVAHSSRMKLLRRPLNVAAGGEDDAGVQQQLQEHDQLPMRFCWSSVIWKLALQHNNLQVQKMALKTLLKRHWPASVLQQLPLTFITDTLLPALMSPIHHKLATAGGLSATGGAVPGADTTQQQGLITAAGTAADTSAGSFNIISQAAELLSSYARAVGPAGTRALLAAGIRAAGKPGQDMPRSGLLAVLKALAGAAAAAGGVGMLQGLTETEMDAFCEDCFSKLHSLLIRLQVYAGQAFRISCYNLLLALAAAVAPAGSCKLAAAATLLQQLPAHMQAPGGQLHDAARHWLLGSGSTACSNGTTGTSSIVTWLSAGLADSWQHYFSPAVATTADALDSTTGTQQQQSWVARSQDYQSWRTSCDTYLRVLLCSGNTLQQHMSVAMTELADRTEQLTSRSYLAPGAAEKVLLMLTVLLEGAEAAGRVAVQSGQQLPALTTAAVKLAEAVAGPLGRCLEQYCTCYRTKPTSMAGISSDNSHRSVAAAGAAVFGLCPAAWAATARAEAAARAAAAAALLLARHAANCWDTCGALDVQQGAAMPAITSNGSTGAGVAPLNSRLLPALQKLVGKMAETGELLTVQPLPSVQAPASAAASDTAGTAAAALGAALCEAAAAEQSKASAIKVLGYVSTGLSRSLICCPALRSQQLPCLPVSWLDSLLQEVASAQAAHKGWLPIASAVAGLRSGDPMKGWLEGMDWNCCAGIMSLTAVATAQSAAHGASPHTDKHSTTAVQQTIQSTPGPAVAGCYVPAGVFSSGALVAVLCHALDSLQWTVSEAGSELLQLLRCLRRVWVLLADDEQLQVAAVQALVSAGILSSPDEGSNPLTALAGVIASGVLDMIRGSKKKPQLMYSLAINTVLLPQLCIVNPQQQPHISALHTSPTQAFGPTPPLKRFIQGLVQQGQRGSPRLMLVLGLQLGTYVSCCPQLLTWYAEELRQIVLFGVSSHGPGLGLDSEMQGLPSLEEGQERSLLVEALDPDLQEAYTLTDIGGRVAVLCGLHQLAVAAGLEPNGNKEQQSRDASTECAGGGSCGNSTSCSEQSVLQVEAAGVGLWNSWLQAYLCDAVLGSDRFKVGSDIHRLKVRAWQGLAAAANFLGSHRQRAAAAAAVKEILLQLGANQPPSIKQYQEAILVHLLLQHPSLFEELLLPHITSVEKGSSSTGSHILVAVQVALHSEPEKQLVLLPQLIRLLLPWTNHHTHNIRTFAQLGVCALLDSKPLDVWPGWEQGLGPGGAAVVGEVLRFMHDNLEFQRFRKAMGNGILAWSPLGVTAPRRIFSCSLYLAGAEDSPVTFEGVPEALMDRLVNFLTAERAKLREAAVDRVAGYEGGPSAAFAAAAAGSGNTNGVGDYQRKVTPSERAVLMADVLDELEQQQQGGTSGPAGTQRSDLIIVASLISKVPNLGGLARTAEVLGAGTLVLADKKVTQEVGFTSVSVTAERWVPVEEVKEAALLGWLAAKQAQGYALVGLEQTAESTCLPNFEFPSKTVLVLGREKEGIPPEVIAMLDATVEIPQLGVIRSLNVHVSGAIAMYEYAKQQLASTGVDGAR